jgi:hypothetical protein
VKHQWFLPRSASSDKYLKPGMWNPLHLRRSNAAW